MMYPYLLAFLLEDIDLNCFGGELWIVMEERRDKEGCVGKGYHLSF
jgi:hypothetical protein